MKQHKVATGILVVVVIAIISAAAGGSKKKESTSSPSSPAGTTSTSSKPKTGPGSPGNEPSKNASEENTPSVGPHESVEVDDLRWRLLKAEVTHTIGEPSGLGATANGIFVVVTLHVTNKKHTTATMTDEIVTLVAQKKEYKVSTSAETALIGEGGKTFLVQELGPEVSLTGRTGFDIPPQVLHEHPQLRFNELGFGSTHGYIALPDL
jgi:hypothetical protein